MLPLLLSWLKLPLPLSLMLRLRLLKKHQHWLLGRLRLPPLHRLPRWCLPPPGGAGAVLWLEFELLQPPDPPLRIPGSD